MVMTTAQPAPPRSRAAWERPAVGALLLATALLYLWGLGESGWANSFYSAAAQAGADNWKAFFFGSSDVGNSITVDKTPASLWLMAASVRVFGLNSWAILVPEALCGVAAVGILYLAVRRWHGAAAGLIAGAAMALTPVAVLMFRFNNPDALLVLLLVAAAYATQRAIESANPRWIVLAGALVGFGFLTKMLQALLVVPALALAYVIAAPATLRRRLVHLLAGGAALLVAAGWWVAIVELIPASARPYIGGSQTNSVLELTFGYNGFGRLTGDEVGSVGGQRGWGEVSFTRLFDSDNGGQVSWLLPAALILVVALAVVTARAPRLDRTRAALIIWGGWLGVTALTFSLMAGIFHPYYSVALAPAIGAMLGIGTVVLWRRRDLAAAATLAAVFVVTAIWSRQLLGRSPQWHPWLSHSVLAVGLLAAGLLIALSLTRVRVSARASGVVLAAGLVTCLAGPAAYALNTASTPHEGAIPSAGPAVRGGFGGGFGVFGNVGPRGGRPGAAFGLGAPRGGPFGGFGNLRGATGGLLQAAVPSSQLVALLQDKAGDYTWAAAAVGSNSAAGLQLAARVPVMPIGGFNGSDPSPTLEQFQEYVASGRIHYFIGGGGFGNETGSREAARIAAWVAQSFQPITVGMATLYDLSPGGQTA
jgi:4-amino-4-deoxy-L-arabinose transferase-like glycosyltransferase